jgi:hypothetical protein
MLEEMPSSDFVSSSRKCRRLPNTMSRITSRLHRSPITSSVRLIAQPERMSSVIAGFPKNCLQYRIGFGILQPVAKCKQ